jgi:diaminopimelate epimerase
MRPATGYKRRNETTDMTAPRIPFAKMNGLGNQIIVADMRGRAEKITSAAAIALARPQAIPFDQIMEVRDPAGGGRDQDIRILNSDGSLAQSCGNGTRCVVAWLNAQNSRNDFVFDTDGGRISSHRESDRMISVDMGAPRFDWREIPLAEEFADTSRIELQVGPIDKPVLHTPAAVSMGNPHAVFFVTDSPYNYALDRFGPLLENHPIFPERANITVAQVTAHDRIVMRTWERGAGLTLACGSAACATLVCAARRGLTGRKATVNVPGGDLVIEWLDNDRVMMSGPAEFEFFGELDPATGEFEIMRRAAS